MAKDITSIWA